MPASEEDLIETATRIEGGTFEKQRLERNGATTGDNPNGAKKSDADPFTADPNDADPNNTDPFGADPLSDAVAAITHSFYEQLSRLAGDNGPTVLKAALRASIGLLEDLYSQT